MGIVTLNLGNYNFKPFDEKVVKIDAWYDRHTRDYCIQKMNAEGYQVGDAIRVGTKADKEAVVKELKVEYGL